ncbi:MAG: hypothetical protein JO157_10465 [Acetobacteraceae bacterium]|nr:hypothetical protein [Acetobacteraceae bacterium]
MNETLAKFEALAEKARAGDVEARREFFAEGARLFPADFGGGHAGGDDESDDRIERALAIIRQTVSTGG